MKEQKSHIDLRVSPEEKQKIDCIAAKCGLTTSEYLRQRALGFAPRAIPPDTFWRFCEMAGELVEKNISPEVNDALLQLIHDTAEDILIPGKDRPKYPQAEIPGGAGGKQGTAQSGFKGIGAATKAFEPRKEDTGEIPASVRTIKTGARVGKPRAPTKL